MTDQLPRQIPSDPAEQERLMPEWVKVEAAKACSRGKVCPVLSKAIGSKLDWDYWNHALTIWQWMPEPVDPDVVLAREVCADEAAYYPENFLDGGQDDYFVMRCCLAMAKRIREPGK